MSLADVPKDTHCRIQSVLWTDSNAKYFRTGINRGNSLQVICQHPASKPRFIEVKLENDFFVTLPMAFAKRVAVEII